MADVYHVLNRSVEGRKLFEDSSDYVRFVHNMYQFNDRAPALELPRRVAPHTNVGFTKSHMNAREVLVDIHGWCLMKDHYHLLISERNEGNLSLFLRKLNIGYANYFNERRKRSGALFQGRTKKIPVVRDAHFNYILFYIHLNPLDYLNGFGSWRLRDKNGIGNVKEALTYLDTYRWSSHLDYTDIKNLPSLITTSLFGSGKTDYRASLMEFLKSGEREPRFSMWDFVNPT